MITWRTDWVSRTQGSIAAWNFWAWAASRVQSSVALAKIKASHSCAHGKGCSSPLRAKSRRLIFYIHFFGRERRRRKLTRRRYISYGPNFCLHVDGKNWFLELIQDENNWVVLIFNYIRKSTSCSNNTKFENPGSALPHYLRLLFIWVLLFYLRFTFLFVFGRFICVFNLLFTVFSLF